MKNKLWVNIVLGFFFTFIIIIASFNYIADPYGIYNSGFFKDKPASGKHMRIVKAVKLQELKPVSIALGTSRTDVGINPEHPYFIKPSYNLALSGGSLYESKLYLENVIKQGNLKQVLLVADWRMFNEINMRQTSDIERYFDKFFIYAYLINYKTLTDSYFTIKNQGAKAQHHANGQMDNSFLRSHIISSGGHLKVMNSEESYYYQSFNKNNTYKSTNKNSFEDFEEIVRLCYKNGITLDIIFGPSHIRQWESFDYHIGIDVFYKWKKDVVLTVDKIAKEENTTPYRIMDFSVYHELTAEKVPEDPAVEMKYHFEGSHYKEVLANIVLDRLLDKSPYKDFGIELNVKNIDSHLENLRNDRAKYIDTDSYRKNVINEK